MSDNFNKLSSCSDSNQNENNDVAFLKGSRSSGNLSKGICNSAMFSSKSMRSKLTSSKLLSLQLNRIKKFDSQSTVSMDKLVLYKLFVV